ncbi:hypothetical protein B0J13DRAFT_623139 [Dactylonectria estremocensis]|uniref:BHLH domain-containing protein n=1 Tax=Dactylonectria estremocensis TaxID=1079267 RepID=A0A9P9J5G4_9HYPO|nr:hypothetical protein B0J13DRAFT_623139 [Dactylonectria estremocensis]
MAGDNEGDASFYDFLIKEPEMPMPMSTASTSEDRHDATPNTTPNSTRRPHLEHLARLQQPIPALNRTSAQPRRHLPNPVDPRHSSLGTVASHVVAPRLPHISTRHHSDPDQSRAVSHPGLHPHSQDVAHLHALDLHAHDLHGHNTHSQAPLAAASYSAPITIAPAVSSMPMDWGLYGVAHPSMSLNPSPFDFEVPGAMMPAMSHHGQLSPSVSDNIMGYGSSLVSPSSIHSPQGHYAFGSSWEDNLGPHEGSTPKVTTPAAQVSTNPWIDPDELQKETDHAHRSRPKKNPRSRKPKSDAGNGGSPDGGSPSSASQNSRASAASKATSMASSVASSTSSRLSKLRSASRTSKNSYTKPTDTPEERRTRASHNLVEKQYRNRLNAQFESLLNALPEQVRTGGDGDDSEGGGPVDWGDRRVSKGEVLEMARKHIETLERERDVLEREKMELQGSLHQLNTSASGSDGAGAGEYDTPLDFSISMDDDDDNEDNAPE